VYRPPGSLDPGALPRLGGGGGCARAVAVYKPPQKKGICLVAKLPPPGDQGVNARATGEVEQVVAVEQSSNNDKGDVKNTFQVLAELKKQQREAPFIQGATDGCTPGATAVQYIQPRC
jgi:hypothetical protein